MFEDVLNALLTATLFFSFFPLYKAISVQSSFTSQGFNLATTMMNKEDFSDEAFTAENEENVMYYEILQS